MDWIIAEQIELWSLIGVTEREREQPTGLEMDLRLGLDLSPAGRSDELTDTLDYAAVVELVRDIGAKEQCILLEALAEKIKQTLFSTYPQVITLELGIYKKGLVPGTHRVGIWIERERSTV